MKIAPDSFETNYAKLKELSDLCSDPRAALYICAYLTAGYAPDTMENALRAARAFVEANEPAPELRSSYDDRD